MEAFDELANPMVLVLAEDRVQCILQISSILFDTVQFSFDLLTI